MYATAAARSLTPSAFATKSSTVRSLVLTGRSSRRAGVCTLDMRDAAGALVDWLTAIGPLPPLILVALLGGGTLLVRRKAHDRKA